MSRIVFAFVMLGVWLWPVATAGAQPASRVSVSLHARSADPAPGQTTMLAIRFTPDRGWHGYWSNPGDSGLPPTVKWDAPPGVRIGPLQHPAPELLRVAGMTSFVHGGQHVLLAPMRVPLSFKAGDALAVKGDLDFLICSDSLCVPQKARVNLNLTVGKGTVDPASRALFAVARQAIPQPLSSTGEFTAAGRMVQLLIPAAAKLNPARATFYPAAEGVFERSGARLLPNGSIEISGSMANTPTSLSGIVSDGRRAAQLRFLPASAPSDMAPAVIAPDSPVPTAQSNAAIPSPSLATSTPTMPIAAASAVATTGLVWALLGALVGGLLLNLMPCVFPILSLKALHLARSGSSDGAARRDALAYAGGTTATCLTLGLVLLGLREAGVSAGWSFQLQNPYVILALLALVTGIALNLAGLFHVSGPSVQLPDGRGDRAASFGTGALAAFIATPCSAPFMASALGAALLLPPLQGLLVFAALGLGLALPFVLIGWFPALRSRLPRPGAWMATLQRVLSVPMFITALGLAWVFGRQVGIDGMALGLGAVLVLSLGLWWVGRRQHGGESRPWLPLLPAALLSMGTASLAPAMASAPPPAVTASHLVEPFSEARLAELRAKRTPVFVDFTADWCLTCKVNEEAAIERDMTQAAFARHGVVTLVGDWTRGDPAITRFLAGHDRNSIPFYLFYAPGKEARVLPQILTTGGLVAIASGAASQG